MALLVVDLLEVVDVAVGDGQLAARAACAVDLTLQDRRAEAQPVKARQVIELGLLQLDPGVLECEHRLLAVDRRAVAVHRGDAAVLGRAVAVLRCTIAVVRSASPVLCRGLAFGDGARALGPDRRVRLGEHRVGGGMRCAVAVRNALVASRGSLIRLGLGIIAR